MTISQAKQGTELILNVAGRLDTTTAPQLEAELKGALPGISSLVFDFADLEYISSAGLRVLLSTQKVMSRQGEMRIQNVCEMVKEVFDVTGFTDILTIE